MSLAARHLEEQDIPTVIIGSARDIVEECGVPRHVFVDFPLGNPVGKPDDPAMQRAILELALQTLESAPAPRTTVQAPFDWGSDEWRDNYMRVDDSNRDELRRLGDERRAKQATAKKD
ncbi:MAG: hypothetical protein HKN94_13740 [Acidimicrobiales bacterium]|nr:hypothetical protein [Acidimicrobiia bacterium]NNC81202.1 hypothetical protein [Acidimicrobiales bacterium]RZV45173.1 MAG: hypothetical protein EX269_10630 [Acidimicrobiales bacterium]